MEGNECYKFSTIRRYVQATGAAPMRTILDVGANVGDVTRMLAEHFPAATIYAFEPVDEYFERGRHNTRLLPQVHWVRAAVSMQQRFRDDLGEQPRAEPAALRVLKALPEGGPGWVGGSMVIAADHPAARGAAPRGYELAGAPVAACELGQFLRERRIDQVDLLKMDCEGCEHHVLGCADAAVLRKLRYITGEYHGIERFHRILRARLFATHKVNLIGTRELGCFFAERLDGSRDAILRFDRTGMLVQRPWLSDQAIDWHLFNETYVGPDERWFHALA